ncbi:hypothetical protein KPG71_08740 [Roseovarius sp. PS-C2]|uniref:imm11 family protein n=1 Tax=Roseovarius sp. PS-C2 TaxID=2820814 RepID=UPI001C0E8033|nr:DUF1629 domain-containing protein [Roseovarius sp. PS-C2]MBU3260094.1 hypothetical protein [Roseovarius sp. PS-C2]
MPNETAPDDLPKIWYTRILQSTNVQLRMDFSIERDALEYKHDFILYRPVARKDAPTHLTLKRGHERIASTCKDAFIIIDGLLVISPKFRDVLTRFDLGRTGLFEVPIYQPDGETLSDYPPHYILHVAETKDCFVPEASEYVRQMIRYGETEPRPNAPWAADFTRDRLAVRASAAEGVDLWAHPNLSERLFFSDRLKQAIEAAELATKDFGPIAATIVA